MSFTAVTWNLLAQAYLHRDRYPDSPPEALEPAGRRALILSHLTRLAADFFCLQEVEPDAFAAVGAHLGDAYRGLYAPKTGRPDGAAIFFRADAFSLESTETLHYDACDPGCDHLALIARGSHGDRPLTLVSTHLRWQRRDTPPAQHQGRRQMVELLDRLGPAPAIVAGDLNSLSEGPTVRAALARGLRLSCRGQRPWDTCNIDRRPRKLDYLLYRPDALSPTPASLPRLARDAPMPSLDHPSDHLPVEVSFRWC